MFQQTWPYQTVGNPNQPPLVLLHGFMGRGNDWLPIAEQLAEQWYCLLPDLPGHGQNVMLSLEEPLTFDTVSQGFFQWLAGLGLSQVHLLGYSMGGRLALYGATQAPHKIKSLILESANPGLRDMEARQARVKLDDERASTMRWIGMAEFVEQWYQMGLFASLKQHPQTLAQIIRQRKQNNVEWVAKVIAELSPGRQPPVWNRLARLSMPVLLLTGALDSKYVTLAEQMASLIPQATVNIIPQAGHNIHLEQPGLFIERIDMWNVGRGA